MIEDNVECANFLRTDLDFVNSIFNVRLHEVHVALELRVRVRRVQQARSLVAPQELGRLALLVQALKLHFFNEDGAALGAAVYLPEQVLEVVFKIDRCSCRVLVELVIEVLETNFNMILRQREKTNDEAFG